MELIRLIIITIEGSCFHPVLYISCFVLHFMYCYIMMSEGCGYPMCMIFCDKYGLLCFQTVFSAILERQEVASVDFTSPSVCKCQVSF